MNVKLLLVAFAVGAAIGGAVVYRLRPTLATKSAVSTQEVQVRVIKQQRTVVRPDGTRETITTVTDNTIKSASSVSSESKPIEPQYLLGITAGSRLDAFKPTYGAQVAVRALGPLHIGVYGRTDGEFGLMLQGAF